MLYGVVSISRAIFFLHGKDGYCCLGVLCIVAQENGIKVNYDHIGYMRGGYLDTQERVQKWAGLKTDRGANSNRLNDNLTLLNDNKGFDFLQIADYIEQNAAGLFVQENEDA